MRKILFLLLFPLFSLAQGTFDYYGYAKYLFMTSKSPLVDGRLNDHILHCRLNTRWYPAESLTGAMELRLRGFYGESVENIPGFKYQVKSAYEYAQLDAELWDEKKSFGYAEIDRLYLDYIKGDFQITAGRQRIAWGTSLVWNIIDLFNPMSILEFDYEEKPGADALRVQYYTGAVTKVETAYKPGKNKYSRTLSGLWSINAWQYDFFVIAALQNNRKILGGAWSGNISGGGFRGEIKISEAPSKGAPTEYPVPNYYGSNLTEYDKTAFSAVLCGDYTFTNTLYIHTEALYNSNGKTKNAGAFMMQTLEAGMLSPARWQLYQEFACDITPLIRGTLFGIYNPSDKSSIIVPSLTWSVVTNLDFTAIGFISCGGDLTEYGDMGNSLFLRLKYSF